MNVMGNINEAQLHLLKSISKPGEDLVGMLINVYLDTTPPIITELKSAWSRGDRGETARHAHKLKSSSANLGLIGLSKLCQTIEQGLKAEAVLDYDHLVARVDEFYLEGKIFLETYKEKAA